MKVEVGLRVVRGPDWQWGDQDGGEGHVGTVVEVGDPINNGRDGRAVIVQWDCGNRCKYRCGVGGKYDLRVFDPAPTGNKEYNHQYYLCHSCSIDVDEAEAGYCGFIWGCSKCHIYSLCTPCYMSGKHNSEHEFDRYYSPHSVRQRVHARKVCNKVEAWGIFPGASVVTVSDWQSKREGGEQAIPGCVLRISEDSKERSEVDVEWPSTNQVTKCKVGREGKVDVKYVKPASCGYYFPSHLPVLGAPDSPVGADEISPGDFVRVELDVDVLRIMQEDHGGWNDDMKPVGVVHSINDSGDLRVTYREQRWLLNPSSVVKLECPLLESGDVVRVIDDKEAVMKFQRGLGTEWNEEMVETLGRLGTLGGEDEYGMVSVVINRRRWIFNPLCLVRVEDSQDDELQTGADDETLKDDPVLIQKVQTLLAEGNSDVLAYAAQLGDDTVIREYLATAPNEVNKMVDGQSSLHYAVRGGHVPALEALLTFQPNVDITDEFGHSPLFYCLRCLKVSTSGKQAELLLNAGADPNLKNVVGETVLMKAAEGGVHALMKALTNHPGTDVSIEDLDGNTSLHHAVIASQAYSTRQLLKAGADPSRVNSELLSALHLATKRGFVSGVEEMVESHPELINIVDDDGCTPLHLAVLEEHNDIATYLMQQPTCNIDSRTKLNRTPLHAAVIKGNCVAIERLVGYGANLNLQDHEAATPLHIATFIASKLSLAPTVTFTPSERTPELNKIHQTLAKEVNVHTVMACFLLHEGADTTVINCINKTPLQGCETTVVEALSRFTTSTSAVKFHGSLRYPATITPGPAAASESALTSGTPKRCELCDEPVDIKFLPCGHAVVCKLCAYRATKCLECQKRITGKV